MAQLITFSSDYGPTDEFVAVCHLVMARIAPDVRIVDGPHGIRGVRGGSVVLAQTLIEAPDDAIHLAVVDPGVGTERRGVVIAAGNGSFLIGPDNGIFFPVADRLGGALAAYELTESWFRREPLSSTFHGRDIFAPAAAHLALGVPFEEFGPAVATSDLVRLDPPFVRVSDGELETEVVRTDWFGNVQTAATSEEFAAARLEGDVDVNGHPARVGEKFADVEPGALIVYVNSADHVAIARNGGSARELLQDPERVTVKGKR